MATSAQFAATAKSWLGQVSAANTNRDGTGTIVTIATAGSSGSRIDRVLVQATVTTTAGMVRLYVNDGTNTRLMTEIPVTANTVSSTNPGFSQALSFSGGLMLPSGWSLRASTHNAEAINVLAIGGDF